MTTQEQPLTTPSVRLEVLASITPCKGCDPCVADGVACLKQHVSEANESSDSYSLTSRRYSLWSLIRKYLDSPFREALATYDGAYERQLIEGLQLSTMGRKPPRWRTDAGLWAHLAERGSSVDPVKEALELAQKPSKSRLTISAADSQIENMGRWDKNLRFAIHSISNKNQNSADAARLCATLDTARELIFALGFFRPHHGIDTDHVARLRDDQTRRQEESYCELCWRETMRSRAISHAEQHIPCNSNLRKLSNRFCTYHDPSEPRSLYRKDHAYKAAFHRELNALRKLDSSEYLLRFSVPPCADMQEIRKTAYDLVHAGLKPIRKELRGAPSLREKIFYMRQLGTNQSTMAQVLGISRQAVSKASKSLDTMMRARSAEEALNPTTGEAFSSCPTTGSGTLLEQVEKFTTLGLSIPEIARRTGRFKHTVSAIIRSQANFLGDG